MKKLRNRFTSIGCAAAIAFTCCMGANAASYQGNLGGYQWNARLNRSVYSVSSSTDFGRNPSYGDTKYVSASCEYYQYGVSGIRTWSSSDRATTDGAKAAVYKDFSSHEIERMVSASSSHTVAMAGGGTASRSLSA